MSLSIEIDSTGPTVPRATLYGRLDNDTADQLDQRLAPLLAGAPTTLVLDLSGLEYISSAGIRSLFKARKALAGHDGKLLVANLQPQIQKVFDLVNAVPLSDIFATREEVDNYLDAMQKRVLDDEG